MAPASGLARGFSSGCDTNCIRTRCVHCTRDIERAVRISSPPMKNLSLTMLLLSVVACNKLTAPPADTNTASAASPSAAAAPNAAAPKLLEGLQKTDVVVGTGAEAKAGDSVRVHYVGTLMDGTEFDASKKHGDTGFTFPLGAGRVIKGWDLGVAGMKVGGKRTLVIAPELGYGERGAPGAIPPNATLKFEVELLEVTPKG